MAELRLHKSLYAEPAVRATVAAFARLARLELRDLGPEWAVDIQDPHPRLADRLEDELANYALAATVQARGTA